MSESLMIIVIWIIVGVAILLAIFRYLKPGDILFALLTKYIKYQLRMAVTWILDAVGAAFAAYDDYCKPPPPSVVSLDQYWGPGSDHIAEDASIKPFKIKFNHDMISDLKKRLAMHRPISPPLKIAGFEHGVHTNYLNKVVAFWKEQYHFKAREKFLNKFPQFVIKIQGLDIHFLHAKPEQMSDSVKVLPLLLLHGWPGSVSEFYKMIPLLRTTRPRRDFVFEVIAPSLPGFGFSQSAAKPGMGTTEIAVVCHNLMSRLGHDHYIIQGSDWGSTVGSVLCTIFPTNVIGYHAIFPVVYPTRTTIKWLVDAVFPSVVMDEKYVDVLYPILKHLSFKIEESGYLQIQASKSDTVGVGLNDSPVGLAAYILEKFSTATDNNNRQVQDGNLTEKFDLIDLVDNLMIYWVSGSITTSMRLYAETVNKKYTNELKLDSIPTKVPTAAISFQCKLSFRPTSVLTKKFPNLVQHNTVKHMGHFAAMMSPNILADDLFQATDKFLRFNK